MEGDCFCLHFSLPPSIAVASPKAKQAGRHTTHPSPHITIHGINISIYPPRPPFGEKEGSVWGGPGAKNIYISHPSFSLHMQQADSRGSCRRRRRRRPPPGTLGTAQKIPVSTVARLPRAISGAGAGNNVFCIALSTVYGIGGRGRACPPARNGGGGGGSIIKTGAQEQGCRCQTHSSSSSVRDSAPNPDSNSYIAFTPL